MSCSLCISLLSPAEGHPWHDSDRENFLWLVLLFCLGVGMGMTGAAPLGTELQNKCTQNPVELTSVICPFQDVLLGRNTLSSWEDCRGGGAVVLDPRDGL